jgi:hypothetical protein
MKGKYQNPSRFSGYTLSPLIVLLNEQIAQFLTGCQSSGSATFLKINHRGLDVACPEKQNRPVPGGFSTIRF